MGKAMRGRQLVKDIPQLTEYLANNKLFIEYSLKINKTANSNLSSFQKFLHEAAFPEEDASKSKKDQNTKQEEKRNIGKSDKFK